MKYKEQALHNTQFATCTLITFMVHNSQQIADNSCLHLKMYAYVSQRIYLQNQVLLVECCLEAT